jgi:hypothetical protein
LVAEIHLAVDQAAAVHRRVSTPSLASVIATYYQLTGGVAGPDVGTSLPKAYRLWQTVGMGSSRLVGASQLADPKDFAALREAIAQLGGVIATIAIPSSLATHLPGAGKVLRAIPGLTIARAQAVLHAVVVVGYDRTGPQIATWSVDQQVTWPWWRAVVRSVDPVVTTAITAAGHGPSGIPSALLLSRWVPASSPAPSSDAIAA